MGTRTKARLQAQVKTTIASEASPEHGVFGKGTVALLHGVEEFGSLNRAAKELGMAYSKAWTLIRDVEANFGVQLLDRDGARGSQVTEEGKRLIAVYDVVAAKTADFAAELFEQEIARR